MLYFPDIFGIFHYSCCTLRHYGISKQTNKLTNQILGGIFMYTCSTACELHFKSANDMETNQFI